MSRRVAQRRAQAAVLVAGLLLLTAGLPSRRPAAPPCLAPRALARQPDRPPAVACGPGAEARLRGAPRLLFGLLLDLNRVEATALEALPGIGPARAAAIVRERRRRRFCTLEDLSRVPGVGPRTLARLEGRATARAAPGCPRRDGTLYTGFRND